MVIIGGSGLLLWFPVFFAKFLPGWMFNIAALVHGEEALLAVGFIFTFHFFNGHLRPEKFPMDTVVFTGRISEHELKDERRSEYERLTARRPAGRQEAPPPTERVAVVRLGRRRYRADARHRRDRTDPLQLLLGILSRGPFGPSADGGPTELCTAAGRGARRQAHDSVKRGASG